MKLVDLSMRHPPLPNPPPQGGREPRSRTYLTMHRPSSQLPHHLATETVDGTLARERHEPYLARLPRLEPHRRAGGDIEPHAARLFAVKFQRRIGLEEMIVRADLDRTIAGIGDR